MFAAVLLIATAWTPQTAAPAADPGGWGAAKWGMTSGEVLAAVKGAKKGRAHLFSLEGGPTYSVQLTKATSYGVKVGVHFGFDKAGHLSEVVLQPEKSDEASFLALKNGLLGEIGQPSEEKPGGARVESRWSLPSTKVLLMLHDALRDPLVKANQKNLPYIVPPSVMLFYRRASE